MAKKILFILTAILSVPLGFFASMVFSGLLSPACSKGIFINCSPGTIYSTGFPLADSTFKVHYGGKFNTIELISQNDFMRYLDIIFWILIIFWFLYICYKGLLKLTKKNKNGKN